MILVNIGERYGGVASRLKWAHGHWRQEPGLGSKPRKSSAGLLATPRTDLPSAPNTSPQWKQKKCSGCQVWFIAVSTFWKRKTQSRIRKPQSYKPGLWCRGRKRGSTYIQDGSSTVSTAWGKEIVVVLGAVGQATPLKEGLGADLLLAVSADKVLWMPHLP